MLVLFAVLMATLIYTNHMRQIQQASSVLASFGGKPILERAASYIDMDKFEHLRQTLDPLDPYYIQTQQTFVEIRDESQCVYLYLLSPDENGVHRYIFDTEGDDEGYVPLGVVEDISDYEHTYLDAYETQQLQIGYIDDVEIWGYLISAYLPIVNDEGVSVGVLGVDFDGEEIYHTINQALWMQIGTVLLFISICFAIYLFFMKDLSNQNNELARLNSAKTEFLQDMSHEMKTPLTVIATGIDFADAHIKRGGDVAVAENALDMVRNETQRLGRMVGSMVNLASMSDKAENRRRVDFAAFLKDSAEVFRISIEKRNIALVIDIASGLPDVYVEADKFTHVMSNLFTNAIRHTHSGRISLTATHDDALIIVSVSDTGEGISPDILPHVFRHGVSGRGGTGYGLSLCKTIVEAHGGAIAIESELGQSTTVTFTVPIYGGQEAGHQR